MSDKRALRIQKSQIAGLIMWLNVQPLAGKQSRIRTRFAAALGKALQQTEAERREIIGKYVEKELDKQTGKEVWKTQPVDNGQTHYVISPEKVHDFNNEIQELYSEDFVMAVNPETEENIAVIKDILLNTDFEFGLTGDEKSDTEKVAKIKQATL